MASLDQQREQYKQQRFLAMPLAGTIVWSVIGIISLFASTHTIVWSLWIGCGSIFYLGVGIAKLTGEDFFAKQRDKNAFDGLFMAGIVMSLLVFAIAIPVAMIDYKTIPLTVGILAGLMWMPLSWIIQHWIGYFHAITRTLGILTVWFVFPDLIFTLIPAVIVAVYIVSIIVQEQRFRQISSHQ